MLNEKEFKDAFGKLSHDQLLDLAYKLQTEVNALQENNASLNRRMYGRKKETVNVDQLSLFNEVEVIDEIATEEEKEENFEAAVPKKKKHHKNSKISALKEVTIDIKMEHPICDICGAPLSEIKPIVHKRIVYKPAELYVEKTIIHQYTCHKCNEAEETMYIFKNDEYKMPAKLLEGSMASSSFVSHIACDKFVLGIPLYRQEKSYNTNGLSISRQNMSNWLMKCGDQYLVPIYEKMKEDIRKSQIVNMDETTLLCLEEKEEGRESKSYEWLCMTNEYEEKQMALYYYSSDRKKENVNMILGEDYKGIIQSDGYQAYQSYETARGNAGCLSHARRKFEDALNSNEVLYKKFNSKKTKKEEKEQLLEKNPSFKKALWFVNEYNKVLKVERQIKGKTIPEKEEIRNDKSKPILAGIYQEAKDMIDKCLPSGKLYKALQYTINQWEALTYYLQDGRISATNNMAERDGIKPFVMARKNFLFAESKEGARISSIYFSLIISAKMNKLNPEKYIKYVLDQMSEKKQTEELIESCLPYSKTLPNNIKL